MHEKLELEQMAGVGGFFRARVMNVTAWDADGQPAAWEPATEWSEPKHNLILPAGFDSTKNWFGQLQYCKAGTGTSQPTTVPDGTFSQTGTTVTRASGTGTFSAGNVNDFIKFATGERAKITAYTNSVTVTVDRSQTVAAVALTIYKTSRVTLDAWVKETSTADVAAGASGYTGDSTLGTARYWKTFNFAFETSAQTYTEVGIGTTSGSSAQLLSRLLFDSPVGVDVGQFLQVRYDMIATVGNCRVSTPVTAAITGWPYTYNVQSIVSNGTYWDIVLNEACSSHFATGRPITIAGALPATTPISTISSTSSDFTVNATAHGKSVGNSVVIAGASPAGYNGTWTVATVPDANSFTVTSAANLGAGSGGTVRLATPGTWYDGTHTIASFPNSTTIRVTNANSITAAGAAGTVKNNLNAAAICTGWAFYNGTGSTASGNTMDFATTMGNKKYFIFEEANMKTGLQYGTVASISGNLLFADTVAGAYDVGNRKRTFTMTLVSGSGISQTIRQICLEGIYITFEERQRKNNGYQLVVNFTLSWEPDLA